VLRSNAGEGVPAEDKRARDLFGFSILYLFTLFAIVFIERGFA
jgi:heme O synthase-like polyprenyltransferase